MKMENKIAYLNEYIQRRSMILHYFKILQFLVRILDIITIETFILILKQKNSELGGYFQK